jgi:hypothetical protein
VVALPEELALPSLLRTRRPRLINGKTRVLLLLLLVLPLRAHTTSVNSFDTNVSDTKARILFLGIICVAAAAV